QRLAERFHKRNAHEGDVRPGRLVGLESSARVVNGDAARNQLQQVALVRRELGVWLAEQRFLVQSDEHVYAIPERVAILTGEPYLVVRMLAHDVRVVLDVGEYLLPGMGSGAGEHFGRNIDAAALRTANHPDEIALV